MLNWIVVGIGDIAIRRVIPAIQAERRSQLYGVVTRDPPKAAELHTRVWSLLEEALADPGVNGHVHGKGQDEAQAVYIATPVFLHAPQTMQAFQAGMHVLCEKPLAMNLAEARLMLQASKDAGKTFGVAYYRRFYPKVQRAKQLLTAGAIGKPVLAELTCHSWLDGTESERNWLIDPTKAGGGPLYDIASHRIDVLNYLFGQPLQVSGHLSNDVHHYGVEDNATVMIDYENGVRGIVDVRWHSKVRRDECRIRGTEGEMEMSPLNGPELVYPGGREQLAPHDNLHYPMIENFVAAVLDKAPLISSGESAVWTDWVTEKVMKQAAETKRDLSG